MTSRPKWICFLLMFSVVGCLCAGLAQEADDPITPPSDPESPSLTESLPDFSEPDFSVPRDGTELIARINAVRGSFGGDLGEDFKLLMIQELQKQAELFPQQLPGAAAPAGIPTWVSIGPTKANFVQNATPPNPVVDSGRIRTILPHPADPDTLYVLTSGGGLWKTTNFTHPKPTWVPLTDAVISTSGGSVAFGRTPQTLYLGVGDPFDVLGLIAGVMVKSTDGGRTWSPFVDLPGATQVRDVKVDVSGPNDIVLVATDRGLFRSVDNGATYTRVAGALGQAFFRKNVWSLVRTSVGWLASAKSNSTGIGSIFFSTDQGATWLPIPNSGNVISGAGRITLAVGEPGDSIGYAYAAEAAPAPFFFELSQLDLFKSVDGGLNWTALRITDKAPTNPSVFQPKMDLMGFQAFYNQMILVDPSDPSRNTVYLGGQLATAKTTDGGITWTLLSDWLSSPNPKFGFASKLPYVHADHHAAAFSNLGQKPTVFFGTDGGLFISTDAGTSWSDSKNEGIVSALVNTISGDPIHPSRVIIGLQDLGTRVRIPNTTTYNQTFGGDGEGVGWSQANGAVSLTSVPFSRIFRTVNNPPNIQNKWEFASNGIGGLDFYDFFTPIITPAASADPSGLVFFHHTGRKVYRTTDGAGFWTVIGRAGTGGISPSRVFRFNAEFVHTMDVSPVDTDHIAVSALGGFLVLTRNGGLSWVERNLISLVPGYGGFNGSVAWANNDNLYLSSFNPNANSIRLVKSTDGGVSWSVAQTGLPDVPIEKLLVDPRDPSGNTVYAATWIGVHRTTDGGASWSLFGAGLPRVVTSDLYMPPDGSFLRAVTFGRGVWEIKP